jgi:hypothetical protein
MVISFQTLVNFVDEGTGFLLHLIDEGLQHLYLAMDLLQHVVTVPLQNRSFDHLDGDSFSGFLVLASVNLRKSTLT